MKQAAGTTDMAEPTTARAATGAVRAGEPTTGEPTTTRAGGATKPQATGASPAKATATGAARATGASPTGAARAGEPTTGEAQATQAAATEPKAAQAAATEPKAPQPATATSTSPTGAARAGEPTTGEPTTTRAGGATKPQPTSASPTGTSPTGAARATGASPTGAARAGEPTTGEAQATQAAATEPKAAQATTTTGASPTQATATEPQAPQAGEAVRTGEPTTGEAQATQATATEPKAAQATTATGASPTGAARTTARPTKATTGAGGGNLTKDAIPVDADDTVPTDLRRFTDRRRPWLRPSSQRDRQRRTGALYWACIYVFMTAGVTSLASFLIIRSYAWLWPSPTSSGADLARAIVPWVFLALFLGFAMFVTRNVRRTILYAILFGLPYLAVVFISRGEPVATWLVGWLPGQTRLYGLAIAGPVIAAALLGRDFVRWQLWAEYPELFCAECGATIRSESWSFCPACGTDLASLYVDQETTEKAPA